jgi:CheY-like chemotaxis protein
MYKILVIEDEDVLRENIRDMLHAEDFIVVEAENGKVGYKWH